MPRLLNERRLNKVQYISMSDYISSMDSLTDFDDKMAFTTRYLLAYGNGENRDVSFAEAVHIAKLKIAQASAEIKRTRLMPPDEAVNPDADEYSDEPNRQFMIEPVRYLQGELTRLQHNEANDGNSPESRERIRKYQAMQDFLSNDFDNSLSNQITLIDIDSELDDVNSFLKARYGGGQQLEQAYNKTKPGFVAKMFGKYSKAYANLDEVYKAFNNPNHGLFGDVNSLNKAATEYLQHVFPDWDKRSGLPEAHYFNRLSGTQKERALFSFNILKATESQKEAQTSYEKIRTANIQLRAEREANAGDDVSVDLESSNNNSSFQEEILNDIKEEEENELDTSEAERRYHANFAEIESDDEELEP